MLPEDLLIYAGTVVASTYKSIVPNLSGVVMVVMVAVEVASPRRGRSLGPSR